MTKAPPFMAGWKKFLKSQYCWEGFSKPLDCPSSERCKHKSMRGTLAIYGGEEVRC